MELGSALDGDLGQLSAVSIGHLGFCFKALSLTIRAKLILKSPKIHREPLRIVVVLNNFNKFVQLLDFCLKHGTFWLMPVPEFELKRFVDFMLNSER